MTECLFDVFSASCRLPRFSDAVAIVPPSRVRIRIELHGLRGYFKRLVLLAVGQRLPALTYRVATVSREVEDTVLLANRESFSDVSSPSALRTGLVNRVTVSSTCSLPAARLLLRL